MKRIYKMNLAPGADEEGYVDAWEHANYILQQEPGAQGARLHRMVGATGVYLTIAGWDSDEAYHAALARLADDGPSIQEIMNKPETYGKTEVIGLFEEPVGEQLPPQAPRLVRDVS